jgi:secondary thiamine-phosphate synthase enzyme
VSALSVQSHAHEEVIDLTKAVAALTILTNEDGIAEDLLTVLHGLVPQAAKYAHDSADHVRAHVLAALVGPSVSVPVRNGRLALGEFQRIVLLEFEGPRARTIDVDVG